jgi:hypothetical protein
LQSSISSWLSKTISLAQGDSPTLADRGLEVTAVRSAGSAMVLDLAWQRLGLPTIVKKASDKGPHDLERTVFALVAYCALAGRSAASVAEWALQDVVIPGASDATRFAWSAAVERVSEAAVRREIERLALAQADPRAAYLVRDPTAPGDEFALAVGGDRWPVLVRSWPDVYDPDHMPPDWIRLLSDELSVPITHIRASQAAMAAPDGFQEIEWPRYGHVHYRRLDGDCPPGTRRIFVRPRVRDWPWHQADRLMAAGDTSVPDGDLALGYLTALQVRRDFAELLSRPPRAPFTGSDRAAAAWPLVGWIALLLARQVEEDTKQPWPQVRAELQRLKEVRLSQHGSERVLQTPLSPKQSKILACYA